MNLSKPSRELMLLFSKNNFIHYISQTNKTKSILRELYKEILEASNYAKKTLIPNPFIRKIMNASQIPKPQNFNSNAFPDSVRNHIDELMMNEVSYSFSLYERNIKVLFIVENENVEFELQLYNRYLEAIFIWLYILNKYASKDCVKVLTVYLYFTSLKKNLPKTNIQVLNEIHVNTAFTTTCPRDSEVVVFRKEEWFKAFIHETIHNFSLDFSIMNDSVINNCISSIYKVKSDINSFEAYTEFWAEIMNALFCSFYALKDKSNVNEFLSNSEFYINFERTYSIFQLVKVLDFMGLKYSDLYSKSKYAEMLRENLYKEDTNVLSYYIIKTVLMHNYQGFLSWCKINNQTLIDFRKTTENQIQFCKFIERNYATRSLLHDINDATLFIYKISKKKTNNKFVLTNLRMSICELG